MPLQWHDQSQDSLEKGCRKQGLECGCGRDCMESFFKCPFSGVNKFGGLGCHCADVEVTIWREFDCFRWWWSSWTSCWELKWSNARLLPTGSSLSRCRRTSQGWFVLQLLQLLGSSSLFLSIMLPLSVLSRRSWKLFSFQKPFFSPVALRCVCQCVCKCAFESSKLCMFKKFVSA